MGMVIFKKNLTEYIKKVRTYNKIAGIAKIVRRYFAINGFDGVITIIGVLVGSYIIGIRDYINVVIAGAAICISLGVSGVWSAYFSESAERKKEIDDLEKSTLYTLDKTVINYAQKYASRVLAAVNGLSPVVTAFIPLVPFLFGKFISINICYYLGFGLAFLILFGIGLFLGNVSKSNLIISGIKMVFAGIFCIALSLLLKFLT
jgi:predicted membrane protein (TIGR00267 family)